MMLNDRYKLYEALGEGGMAEVFRGEDLRLGREVAVKVLRAQYASEKNFLDRFLNEARSMAGFAHPNVVNVYDVGRDAQRYYIVMEFVPGEDLRQRLEREGQLPMKQAFDIARQMAQGIGYAHRKGLVHRDVKPGNILITPTGEVKVADFGIAKAMASVGLTEPGVVWGTTAYLSPEQVRGESATPASDVYAMGVVLYEMLAGHPPFQGEDRVSIALKHLHDEPPPFDAALQVPRGVVFLVRKALAKKPEERYANADEMARALGEYLRAGADPNASRTLSPPTPGTRPAPRAEDRTPTMMPAAMPRHAEETRVVADDARAAPTRVVEESRRPVTQPPAHPAERRPTRASVVHPAPAPARGPDWVAVMLGLLAVTLVAGLVPLYLQVWNALP